MNKFLSLLGLDKYHAWLMETIEAINSRIGEARQLTFTQIMPMVTYIKNLVDNAFMVRNITTDRDLTDAWYNGNLAAQVAAGRFEYVHPGDYIVGQTTGKTYYVADIDLYYSLGEAPNIMNYHHLVMIPSTNLDNAIMNTSFTTSGGYLGSSMKNSTLASILTNYIEADFGTHVQTYSLLGTNSVDTSLARGNGLTGGSNGVTWVASKCDLMNETMVYGHEVFGNTRDVGLQNTQLAIFRMRPSSYILGRDNVWLRDVASDTICACRSYSGDAAAYYVDTSAGVRPFFLLG